MWAKASPEPATFVVAALELEEEHGVPAGAVDRGGQAELALQLDQALVDVRVAGRRRGQVVDPALAQPREHHAALADGPWAPAVVHVVHAHRRAVREPGQQPPRV